MKSPDMVGKVALVTGAASGLGRAAAVELAHCGARVALVDMNHEGLVATAQMVNDAGREALIHATDLSVADNCHRAVLATVKQFGRLDALINNAGLIFLANTPDMTEVEWSKTVAVNLSAPFFLSQAAIPHLLETDGAIVNVASAASFIGEAYAAAYCATKAGVIGMTKALAMEYMNTRLRINAVAPGGMHTNISVNLKMPDGHDPAMIQRFSGMRGLVEIGDVADMIAYLASDAAIALHGACVTMDRGITAG